MARFTSNRRPRFLVLRAAAIVLAICFAMRFALGASPTTSEVVTHSEGGAEDFSATDPEAPEVARLTVHEQRSVPIRRSSPRSNLPGTYFLWPILIPERNSRPPSGWPDIVASPRVDVSAADGMIRVLINVVLYRQELLAQAAELVREHDADHLKQSGNPRLEVKPWPITAAYVTVTDPFGNRLAVGRTGPLVNATGTISVVLELLPEHKDQFIASANANELRFHWIVRYVGRESRIGYVDVRGSRELILTSLKQLGSAQISGTAPILQQDKAKILRTIKVSLSDTIYAEHPDIFVMLRDMKIDELSAQLFEPDQTLSMADFEKAYGPEADRFLAEYLMPHLQSLQHGGSDQSITVRNDGTEHGTNVQGGIGFSFAGSGASASAGTTDRDLHSFEQQTGVQLTWDEHDECWRPHSVRVTRLREGYDKLNLDLTKSIYYGMPAKNQSVEDTVVPQALTVSETLVVMREEALNRDLKAAKDLIAKQASQIQSLMAADAQTIAALKAQIVELRAANDARNAEDNRLAAIFNQEGNLFRTPEGVFLSEGGKRRLVWDVYTLSQLQGSRIIIDVNPYATRLPIGEPLRIEPSPIATIPRPPVNRDMLGHRQF